MILINSIQATDQIPSIPLLELNIREGDTFAYLYDDCLIYTFTKVKGELELELGQYPVNTGVKDLLRRINEECSDLYKQ